MSTTRPTLEDVARHAGVSRALVSIVVRGAPGASEATRERVLRSAAQLGYRPNTMARRLSSHHTGTVGVVFSLGRAFHTELVEHLYAASGDLELVLSAVTRGRAEQVALDAVLDQRPEAVIVVGGSLSGEELARAAANTPLAVALREVRHDRVDSVRTDEAAGIRAALNHLYQLGHRHVAHVDGGSAPGARARRRAYEGFLKDTPAMGPARLLRGGMTEEDGLRAATELLSGGLSETTAVSVFNDRSALSLLDQLRRADVAVPQRVSVVGFDDIRASALEHVGLTTVRQDGSAIAASLVAALRRRIAEPDASPQRVVINPALVVRSTTGRPASAQ